MIVTPRFSFSRAHTGFRRAAAMLWVALLLVPVSAGAADLLPGADNVPVTRGEFIRGVIKALNIPVSKTIDRNLPYKRVPVGMAPYVSVAKNKGALEMFGDNLQLNKPLTRLEAAVILAKLSGKKLNTSAAQPTFSDVREHKDEVIIVIQNGWMKGSGRVFGSAKTLSTREAKLIVNVLGGGNGSTIDQGGQGKVKIEVPVVRKRPNTQPLQSGVVDQVWRLLSEEYLYQDRLDATKAGTAAVKSLVDTLDDPYTVYMPPVQTERFNDQIKGEIEGIGATVELIDEIVNIVAPIRGSPAEKAGLQPKDQILAVDGKVLKGMSLDEAVTLIRGPRGSTVTLRIRRNGSEFDVSVQRSTVQLPEVEISQQGDVAIVRIVQFGNATDTKLGEYMKDINSKKPKGIVIDLRNNPGGLLHAAGVVVGHFLPKGSVFASIEGRSGSEREVTTEAPTIDASVPVVILVNRGSASASEIVAGAMQDAKRATIIGQKTFGKGTVQQIVTFSDGSSLKFTIAEWKTPSGRKIDGVGVTPDILVDPETGRDPELLRALELLR